jgi:hypothetical protein
LHIVTRLFDNSTTKVLTQQHQGAIVTHTTTDRQRTRDETMSTKRKWKIQWSYGYAGTDNEQVIDLIDDHGWSEEQLADAADEEIHKELNDYSWEMAIEQVESYAEPVED